MYQSRVRDIEELWTFGTAFSRVQLIAQLMESVPLRLRTGQMRTFCTLLFLPVSLVNGSEISARFGKEEEFLLFAIKID